MGGRMRIGWGEDENRMGVGWGEENIVSKSVKN